MKRFYKDVSLQAEADGHAVLLDGRSIKTPAKAGLVLPTAALAEGIADEWRAQGEEIISDSMPLTRLANSVIDGVRTRQTDIEDEMVRYGGTDLVCYWAEHPQSLVERQARGWQPLIDWINTRHGVRLETTAGIIHRAQDVEAMARLRALVEDIGDPWHLGPLHMITTSMGSVVIALALYDGRIDADTAFALGELDEAHQREFWGEDAEATLRRERLLADVRMCARFIELVRG
ncbi:ATP12 family chaperone protein [Govanella unica]|uniref:ATPase n=1 Tax=Govanella unica TaxID=2975056 RepID=A0A9X3TXA3_9PROT|nr:ATP12 family protein [Govania unica]MDA5193087.1 ATPase [Govania unica]